MLSTASLAVRETHTFLFIEGSLIMGLKNSYPEFKVSFI